MAARRPHVNKSFSQYFKFLRESRRHLYRQCLRGKDVTRKIQTKNVFPLCNEARCFSSCDTGHREAEPAKDNTQNTDTDGKKKRILIKAKKEARRQLAIERQKLKIENKEAKQYAVYTIPTKPGEKKDVDAALPDTYSPEYVEAAWYDWWEKEGFFGPIPESRADAAKKPQFAICLPPPNVTGTLHLGHALGNSIQDSLVRWHRNQGGRVVWVPGMDHAGIATQVVVERQLARDQGLSRHQLGREHFIEHVWKWKNEKGGVISDQMRRLGSSLDWSRAFFTLNPNYSRAVCEAFIRLHEEGLIYRKKRLVNWSCALKSAISDIEVENLPVEKKTYLSVPGYDKKIPFGQLFSFAYPVDGLDEELIVATTRPETMLGDTAVAIHPDDPRYGHLQGRQVRHPLTGRHLPVVADTAVQSDFGSGAVKITPGHDHVDHEVGQRHQLELINILDDEGHLTNVPERFQGMPRFSAREAVLSALKEMNLFRGTQDNPMVLPQCSRSGDIIEPLLKDQWYVDCSDMANQAHQAVQRGDLQLVPPMYEAQWIEWLSNTREWCISRQLWWGHRIPVYRVTAVSGEPVNDDECHWVSAHTKEEARRKASLKLDVTGTEITLEQDEDVLDTWFSSAIVPFAAMGWPEQTKDLHDFYPNDLLETASDILFFWVARMVMLGQKLTGKVPFKKVLLHSILRDSHGRKMSKSLGNIIDPMDVINGTTLEHLQTRLSSSNLSEEEVVKARQGQLRDFPLGIPQCGADALHFTLCSYNYKNHFANIDVNHVAANRRFCNKIWQAFRYCSATWPTDYTPPAQFQIREAASATDVWILSQLSEMVARCQEGFESLSLNVATRAIYNFWWMKFCDVYLEYTKPVLQEGVPERVTTVNDVLYQCVETSLRALSPFMPFLTEELYQRLPGVDLTRTPSITVAPYPQPEQFPWKNDTVNEEMTYVQFIIHEVLSLRKEFSLGKNKQEVVITPSSESGTKTIQRFKETLTTLTRSSSVAALASPPGEPGYVKEDLSDGSAVYLKVAGIVDKDTTIVRLTSQLQQLQKEKARLEKRQNDEQLAERTLLLEKDKVNKISSDIQRLERTIDRLQAMEPA